MLPRPVLRACVLLSFAALFAPAFLLAHGDLHARIEALTAEIRHKPDDAKLHLQRGELHRMHEDWALAEADYDRAEKLDPKLATVALGRSLVHLARGRFKQAEAEASRFLEIHPKHPLGLSTRARALSGLKRHLDAAEAWRKVTAAAPAPDVEPYFELAQALVAAGPKHIPAALQALDEGIAKLGNVPALGLRAIELEVEAKRYDAALDRLARVMPKSGRTETWRELRGDILAKSGRAAEAKAEYTKALADLEAAPARARSTKAGEALAQRLRAKARP